jgi:hypothetical protein
MTEIDISKVLIEGDYATIMGAKYKRVVELKSFYDKLWEELGKKVGYGIDCDQLTDRVMDLIKDNIPEPLENKPMENKYQFDILQGYNTAIKEVKERF